RGAGTWWMSTVFFSAAPVANWDSAKAADTKRYGAFFQAMLAGGVYLAPSQFEAGFMSAVHSDCDIDATLDCAARAFKKLA
ncbi:MAG: aspartate aminotransferase family protein, partial [Chloroflexi bacterium]|nr:aspartate aminotransferase family protein [Chloroflexota bacterium]